MTEQQYERRIAELQKVGLELHERCEKWRKALEEIGRFNTDPIIGSQSFSRVSTHELAEVFAQNHLQSKGNTNV